MIPARTSISSASRPPLYTSYGVGEGSPEGFYHKLGFTPTGGHYGDEIEVVLPFDGA